MRKIVCGCSSIIFDAEILKYGGELDNNKQSVNYEYIEKLAEHSSVDMDEPNEKKKAMYEALNKIIPNRR